MFDSVFILYKKIYIKVIRIHDHHDRHASALAVALSQLLCEVSEVRQPPRCHSYGLRSARCALF